MCIPRSKQSFKTEWSAAWEKADADCKETETGQQHSSNKWSFPLLVCVAHATHTPAKEKEQGEMVEVKEKAETGNSSLEK